MEHLDCGFGIVDCGFLLWFISDCICFNPKSAIWNPKSCNSSTPRIFRQENCLADQRL